MEVLDIRDLADEWQGQIDDGTGAGTAEYETYVSLCDELGIDATPDALKSYGENYEPTLIAEHSFVEYARDLAEDCDLLPPNRTWPLNCIDWEYAAKELAYDYSRVTFNGTDYLIRSV